MNVRLKREWDKTFEVKGWVISVNRKELVALCTRKRNGKTVIVKAESETFKTLPDDVVEALRRNGFLEKWREAKIKQSVSRLHEICLKIEKLKSQGLLKL